MIISSIIMYVIEWNMMHIPTSRIEVYDIRLASRGSPAPSALPTRIPPVIEIPKGI